MNIHIFLKTFFLCATFASDLAQAENILFVHLFVTSSHRTAIWPLTEALADRGHNITYIFPLPPKIGHHPKVREITPSKMAPILDGFVSEFDINLRLENRIEEWLEAVFMKSFELCEAFYDSPEVKEWLAEPNIHFDLIMIDGCLGECAYGLVHKFKAKHILFVPLIIPFLQDPFGVVPESSSIPEALFHSKPSEMNFYNRMKTTLIPLLWRYKFNEYLGQIEPVIQKGLNASDLPPLTKIEQDTSLVMLNSYFVEDYPMALPPMFVSYSGLWCSKKKLKSRKPLPQDLEKFIEGSDGFYYISLGSATVVSAMPKSMRDHFFNAFRAFPKQKFLWRWTGPVPEDAPSNLLLLSWFPQHDLLSHPKLIAFMTQTGRPSTQEALCHGVPLITMPIFGDQDLNADKLEYMGATINLDVTKLTEEVLRNSFREIKENPMYRNKMKELSEIFKDRPMDPLDNALYWTEYVMRHNTTLLKPLSMNQTWWQRRLLDVYAAYLVIILGFMGVLGGALYIGLRFILQMVLRSQRSGGKKKLE